MSSSAGYGNTEQAFPKRSRSNASNLWKWWSTVKTAVFGASSALPHLVDRGGKLVLSADEKSSLCSTHFDAKQCRDTFQQQHYCDLSSVLCSVAFWSSFIRNLLLAVEPYSKNNADGMFPLFYKQMAWKQAPKLAVSFRHLVKVGSLLACWRLADAVKVPNESSSSDVGDYRSISITPFLSKVFEKIVAGKLSNF